LRFAGASTEFAVLPDGGGFGCGLGFAAKSAKGYGCLVLFLHAFPSIVWGGIAPVS